MWDRGGRDIDFSYPLLASGYRWQPDALIDKEEFYDRIQAEVLTLREDDSEKYIAGIREAEGRGFVAELTPEGGLELGGRLGIILNSRRKT